MTVARPVAAFFTAALAGIAENLFDSGNASDEIIPDLSCPVDGCCDGINCDPQQHRQHHTATEKTIAGLRYAFTEFWDDLAGWFFVGLLIAGVITVLIPDDIFSRHLGSGLPAMLLMLVVGIPLYICATASTPIAAALILKGVSPGAALVFLLAGPATNVASLTVLSGVLGKRATGIYLAAIAGSAVGFGILVDQVYTRLGVSVRASIGQAAESVPGWLELAGAAVLLILSIKPLFQKTNALLGRVFRDREADRRSSLTGPPPVDSPDNCGST